MKPMMNSLRSESRRQKEEGRKRIGLLTVLTASCLLPPASCLQARAETTNRIVAIVNDEVITEGDVVFHMSALLQEDDPRAVDGAQAQEIRQAVLQRLIEERLILQEAKRMNLFVAADEVAKRLRTVRARFNTKEAYEQMLKAGGLSEEQLKQELREQLLAQEAIDREVRSKIVVSPYEIAKAAGSSTVLQNPGEEVRASHLLIRVTEQRSNEEALALANQLYDQLLKGAEFEALARKYSEDSHAADGGLLGWVRQGQMLPELDHVLFHLAPGELSNPVQSGLGFHLVKVIERRSFSETEAAGARRRLEERLYQEKFAQGLRQWLQELTARAHIELLAE